MLLDNPFVSDNRVQKEAASLVEKGFKVTIVCEQSNDLPNSETIEGIQVIRCFDSFFRHPLSLGYSSKARAVGQTLADLNPDSLHCHDYMMLNLASYAMKLVPNVRLVYDSHEYFAGWPFYRTNSGWFNKLKGFVVWKYFLYRERKISRLTNAIFTTTQAIAERLKNEMGLKHTPMVMANTPKQTALPASHEIIDLKAQLNLHADAILMVQSGNIYQSLDELSSLFDIVCGIDSLHFVLINDRPVAHKARDMIAKHTEWQQRIHVLPYDSSLLLRQLPSCDLGYIFVNSTWESHKLTSINRTHEYALSGLYIVSSKQAELKEMAERYNNVTMYDQSNLESIQTTLTEVVKDLDHLKLKIPSRNGFRTWESEAKRLIALYESFRSLRTKAIKSA